MKKIVLFLFPMILYSQIGINTENPQHLFHTDGKSTVATTNPATGAPSISQQADDVVITNEGRIGVGITAPTQSLDVNGKARIRNTDLLTSTTVSPIFVDENGVVGKANVSSKSQIAFYTSSSNQEIVANDYNKGDEQVVKISQSHESLNTINASIPEAGMVRIDQSGIYLIGASLNFLLQSSVAEAKIYMALNIDVSRDGGTSWTPISGARPIFVLYWNGGMNQSYTLPTVINSLKAGDLIKVKFYRTSVGSGNFQGHDLSGIRLNEGYGAPAFTLSISKL